MNQGLFGFAKLPVAAQTWICPRPGNWFRSSLMLPKDGLGTNHQMTDQDCYAMPYFVGKEITIDQIGFSSGGTGGSAGSHHLVGVYADDDGYPSRLLAYADIVSTSGNAHLTTTLSPGPVKVKGQFWVAISQQGAPATRCQLFWYGPTIPGLVSAMDWPSGYSSLATMNNANNHRSYKLSSVTALPSVFPTGASIGDYHVLMGLRRAPVRA